MPREVSAAALERELYRYYQPDLHLPSNAKRASSDPCLTAFAQLGALRLNTKRAIISVSTFHTEYVIAESGRTLSLRQDNDGSDLLWHGIGKLNPENGMKVEMLAELRSMDSLCMVINDITQDERYRQDRHVTAGQAARFIACTPLKTDRDIIIGAYIVVDDQPRDGLSQEALDFLGDMGKTVMEYLETERIKQQQGRAERMVKALGLFVEGKSSLREWWLQTTHQQQEGGDRRLRKRMTLQDRADEEFGIQDADADAGQSSGSRTITSSRSDLRAKHSFSDTTTTAPEPCNESIGLTSDETSSELSKELQEALLTTDVKMVFSRASNLIREATAVEGVMFYDASLGSFGGSSKKDAMDEKAPGKFHIDRLPDQPSSSSDDEAQRRSKGLAPAEEEEEKTSIVLGFSTRTRSSLNKDQASAAQRSFPESLMRKMLKRYPHGKVFNLEEDGSISSSDSEGSLNLTRRRGQKSRDREEEAAAILAAASGARSVVWFPLWDQRREVWFAASLAWSTKPTRVLCDAEDLTYMASFGNNIMAEVSRLSALITAQMKTDFLASISHELRSPLHGVLASVELLQDTEMSAAQVEMVDGVQASGGILLDTINHILDFSKVNRRTHDVTFRKERRSGASTVIDCENICRLSEEVVDSVCSGRRNRHELKPVIVIVDCAYRPWMFSIDAGAWSRILMNLFSNAIKYTDAGFVKISLTHTDGVTRGNLVLKVTDSGRGISQPFLRHRLYTAFAQEDSLMSGTGLGVSIVRQIVHELGGDMYYTSEQGIGTEVVVRLPLTKASAEEPTLVSEVREKTASLTATFIGYDIKTDIPTFAKDQRATLLLKSSIKAMLRDWFGIKENSTADPSQSDVIVLLDADPAEIASHMALPAAKPRMALVFCKTRTQPDSPTVVYLEQPHGPLKVAKALHGAFVQRVELPVRLKPASPNSLKVLLVEDNEINLKLLLAYMKKLSVSYDTAVNGLEAFNAYKEAKRKYDVILMDISMPVMSGLESTRNIRRYEAQMGLEAKTVIALTGAANPHARQEAYASGIDMYLTKPMPLKNLKSILEDVESHGRPTGKDGKL